MQMFILINGIKGTPGHVKGTFCRYFFGRNKQKLDAMIKLTNRQIITIVKQFGSNI